MIRKGKSNTFRGKVSLIFDFENICLFYDKLKYIETSIETFMFNNKLNEKEKRKS